MNPEEIYSEFLNQIRYLSPALRRGHYLSYEEESGNRTIIRSLMGRSHAAPNNNIIVHTAEEDTKLNRLQEITMKLATANHKRINSELRSQVIEGLDLIEEEMRKKSIIQLKLYLPDNVANTIYDKQLSSFFIQESKKTGSIIVDKHFQLMGLGFILQSGNVFRFLIILLRVAPKGLLMLIENYRHQILPRYTYEDYMEKLQSYILAEHLGPYTLKVLDLFLQDAVKDEDTPKAVLEEKFSKMLLPSWQEKFSKVINIKSQNKKRKRRENDELASNDLNKKPRRSARLASHAKK